MLVGERVSKSYYPSKDRGNIPRRSRTVPSCSRAPPPCVWPVDVVVVSRVTIVTIGCNQSGAIAETEKERGRQIVMPVPMPLSSICKAIDILDRHLFYTSVAITAIKMPRITSSCNPCSSPLHANTGSKPQQASTLAPQKSTGTSSSQSSSTMVASEKEEETCLISKEVAHVLAVLAMRNNPMKEDSLKVRVRRDGCGGKEWGRRYVRAPMR